MKISWRVWVLTFVLALSLVSILNISLASNFLVGALVLSIPFTLTFSKSRTTKVIIMILTVIALILIIFFSFHKGAIITSISSDSVYFTDGLRKGMIITSVNKNTVTNVEDYIAQINLIDFQDYTKIEFQTNQGNFLVLANQTPNIVVSNVPKTNLKTGLDLGGGARAVLKPINTTLSQNDMNDLVSVTSSRLNAFGISDVSVRGVSDLEGNKFLMVEVAGMTRDDLKEVVGQQGKFEAKIGNETSFVKGEKDITFVCRGDATCAGIESLGQDSSGAYVSKFKFSVSLSQEAAQRQARITQNLTLDPTDSQSLSKKLDLYVDDKLVESLSIGVGLKGSDTTQIQISGSGKGETQQEADDDARNSMKKLQTVLITGSLPYKLEIVKLDSSSPVLGKDFTKNIIILGLVVFSIVSLFILRKLRIL